MIWSATGVTDPDAGDGSKLLDRGIQDAAQVAKARDQRFRGLLHVRARNREREQQFDDLTRMNDQS